MPASTITTSGSTIIYESTLLTGYYLLLTTATSSSNAITITYKSYNYPCPFNSAYPDALGNFQPCTRGNQFPPGPPCLTYDIFYRCTSCLSPFVLQNYICTTTLTCPDRYYIKFQQCLPVDPLCGNYDLYTGDCTSCQDPFNYQLISGKCYIKQPAPCNPLQYS